MGRIVSYWMPEPQNNMECGNSQAPCRVGAIKGYEGQPLDRKTYQDLLANRLQELMDQANESGAPYTVGDLLLDLDKADLIADPNQENPDLMLEESSLQQRLNRLGAPGNLPATMPKNNPQAERTYKEVDLESWASSLLEHAK